MACQRNPNISTIAPDTSGDTPSHRNPIRAENTSVEVGVGGVMKYQTRISEREMYMPPSDASLFQRPPAQPKNRLPSTLKPPITPSASADSIGSMPQIARYDGRCVLRKMSCMPQTK